MEFKAKILVVLVVIVSFGLAACVVSPAAPTPVPPTPTPVPPTQTPIPPTPSITVENMIGIWRSPDGLYLEFNGDGTFRRAEAVPWLKTAPFEVGQFQLEGTVLTFIPSNDSQECRGQSGRYQVELTGEGQLQFELQEDECQVRGNWQPRTWDQMLPTPAPSSISVEDLTGVWKKDLAGVFLQLNEDGTYAFADTGPAFLEKAPFDIGEFRLEGTSLTFITSDESIFCVGQTGSYQVELTEQGQFHFELKEDACQNRASGIPGPWIRYEP
jgi:hypothetical protein